MGSQAYFLPGTFTLIISLSLHNNPISTIILWIAITATSIFTDRNWGLWWLSDSSKVTELGNAWSEIQTQTSRSMFVLLHPPSFFFPGQRLSRYMWPPPSHCAPPPGGRSGDSSPPPLSLYLPLCEILAVGVFLPHKVAFTWLPTHGPHLSKRRSYLGAGVCMMASKASWELVTTTLSFYQLAKYFSFSQKWKWPYGRSTLSW